MSKEFLYIPSAYKEGKTYSAIPNVSEADLGGFTRGSSATRVNEQGLIELVGNDIPRIDYSDGGCPKLLLEDSATNLIEYSEDFSQSIYTTTNINITSGFASPSGSDNAYLINGADGSTFNGNVFRIAVSSFFVDGVFSTRIKSLNATSVTLYFRNGSTGQIQQETISIDNDWKSIESFFTMPNSGFIYIGNSDGDFYLWGNQYETGSVATSYIPTNGATAIRQADSGLQTGDIQSYIDSKKGSFEVDWKRIVTDSNSFTYLTLQGDNLENRVEILLDSINKIRTRIKVDDVQFISSQFYKNNDFDLIRIDWQDGEMLSFVNNVLISNIEIDGFSEVALNKIIIDNGADRNSEIKSISISKESDNSFNSWQEISNSLLNRGYRII